MSWIGKDTALQNHIVRLDPLSEEDREGLKAIAFEAEIWEYFVFRIKDDAGLTEFISAALADREAGKRIVFTIRDLASGRVAGSMAFGSLAASERRLEIGWSWVGKPFRGSKINTASKYLMLDHAFSVLECERVEFKTDVLNERARAGLRKIGAVEEGVLRSFNYMPSGRRRDAIYYSILRKEWPEVKNRLLERIARSD